MDGVVFLALLAVGTASMLAAAYMGDEKLMRASLGLLILLALLAAGVFTGVTATIDITKIIVG